MHFGVGLRARGKLPVTDIISLARFTFMVCLEFGSIVPRDKHNAVPFLILVYQLDGCRYPSPQNTPTK